MKLAVFALLFAVAFSSAAIASSKGHMKLLAVSETDQGYKGISADLYLEIQPGEGKVFIESFPLTKMDTQISTRFAKEIACSEFEFDCNKYNFFYTIKADTALVGGPSAGAAAAVLTVAVLEGLEVDESVAMTGTVNSGGVIGPVGGLKEKIGVARQMGIRKVLIPEGERHYKAENASNKSIVLGEFSNSTDLVEYGKGIGVEVIEVSDIREAIHEITGKEYKDAYSSLVIDESYSSTMSSLANRLCDQTSSYQDFGNSSKLKEIYESARNLSDKGKLALSEERYYSAASYCFGSNVRNTYLSYSLMNLTNEQIAAAAEIVETQAKAMEKSLPKPKTITDLQSYATVKERLLDSYDNVNLSIQYSLQNRTDDSLYSLAYAHERINSARAWAEFMGKGGQELNLDKDALEQSCRSKISEAEERYEYTRLFLPELLSGTRKDIDRAYIDLGTGNYELCLSKAAKAKAESDLILSSIGFEEAELKGLVEKKLEIARRTIARSSGKGTFPIVGYSYYEYASSLKGTDLYSALLYTEYALELSNMDIYFQKPEFNGTREPKTDFLQEYGLYAAFAGGILIGAAAILFLAFRKRRKLRVKKAIIRRR